MMDSTKIDKYLLTPEDVAKRIGVKATTLAVWRCTGRVQLPYVLIGRRPMYDPDDIAEFIHTRKRSFPVGGETK